ncbi:AAA family ATPase [Nocardia harenae]|uniref:AAA family ATPase n=1 Tax=Nocardia harenae TaxID=358707 RepID=UPI00083037F7|nr:AAA family ATPase [Nocardia harenae]
MTTDIVLITGAMAAGKSTVAELLARSLPRAAHVRGDTFRRWIVSGRAEPAPPLSADAETQLALRQRLAATVALGYADAGITPVLQDLYPGPALARMRTLLTGHPLRVVVLLPDPGVLAARDAARAKTGYRGWSPAEFDREFRDRTPAPGLRLDTSAQTPEQTVAAIHARWPETLVPDSPTGCPGPPRGV